MRLLRLVGARTPRGLILGVLLLGPLATPDLCADERGATPASPLYGGDMAIRERLPEPPPPAKPRAATDDRGETLETVARVVPSATWVLPADFDGDHGNVSIVRGAIDVASRLRLSSTTSFVFGFGYEHSSYDLSDPDTLVPGTGRLLEDGEIWRISPGFLWRTPAGWGAAATLGLRSSRVPGATFEDSLTWGVTGGVRVPVGRYAITVGGVWETTLDGGGFFAPLLAFSDNSKDGALRVQQRGSGLLFLYDLSDRFGIGLSVRYESRQFRLAANDRIPSGIATDLRVPLGLDVEWKPSPHVSVTLSGGASAYTEFNFEDQDGGKVRYLEAQASPTFSLYVTVKF